ncbi:hypothetical protein [Pandoraea pnomenusa]|uniref:hypothetical protein n=1 Tax=Pandoraea pnomenusa TaxID=93220 RepID=UPI003340F910
MEPITFKECFRGAWRDGLGALRNRPLLCLTIAVIVLVTSALSYSLRQLAVQATQLGEPTAYRLRIALMSLGVLLVNIVAFCVVAIQVYRYSILGPEAARQHRWYGRDLWRYLWLAAQIFISCVVVWFVLGFGTGLALRLSGNGNATATVATLLVLLSCAMFFVIVRLSLIYPQVATGRSKQWRAAWHDSRGHFWSMFGTMIATMLPLVVGGFVVTLLYGLVLHLMPTATVLVLGTLILQVVLAIAWVAVASATAAWIYRRHADRLLVLDDAPDDI